MNFVQPVRRVKLALVSLVLVVGFSCALIFATDRSISAERAIGMKSASYEGSTISSDAAARKDLSCIQEESGALSCFDTKQELVDSPVAAREEAKAIGTTVASVAKKPQRRAKVVNDCGVPHNAMAISEHGDFNYPGNGWNIAGYARQNWYDMTGGYANSASSVSAGDHSGYLADNVRGGTPRLRLEIGQCERWLSRLYFNDRAQSRYRN